MQNSEYNILLPINFSVSSEKLVEALLSFKSEINYKIVALAVVEQKTEEETAQNRLHAFLKEKGLDAECVVKCGNVAKEILSYAKVMNASMILLNKTDIDDKSDNIGEFTKEILRNSEIPVLILKNDLHFSEVSSILLPLDINKENKKKISNALFYAKFFHDSQVRIISVVFDTSDYEMNRHVFQLQHIVHFIEKAGFECTGEIMRCSNEDGDTLGKIVCDYAEKSEAELVLLVTDHEENKNKFSLNTQSEYMLSKLSNNIISITP
jgi:K+-sensing histidine kinase KdpD